MIDSISSAGFSNYPNNRSFSAGRQGSSQPFQTPSESRASNATGTQGERPTKANPEELTDAEKQQVEKLKQRDAEVRTHEQAHLAAAGSLAMGGPNYVYQTGPDGKQYAVGGDVKIDTSPGRTPEETQRKAQQIRAAALAPSDPSPQDLKVAAKAASMEQSATEEAEEPESDDPFTPNGEITNSRQLIATPFT